MYYRRRERREFPRERFEPPYPGMFEPQYEGGLFGWLSRLWHRHHRPHRREWPQEGFYPRTLGSPYVDPSSGALVARAGNPQAWDTSRDWRYRGNQSSGYGYGGNGYGQRHHRRHRRSSWPRSYWPQPMSGNGFGLNFPSSWPNGLNW